MTTQAQGESSTAVDVLPSDVLLDIFDFYRRNHDDTHRAVWEWHILAHVCRTWRQVIFESPHRLDLQIPCTAGTPVRTSLGIWPDFPIAIDCPSIWLKSSTTSDEDNIIAALEHTDRIRYLRLALTSLQLRKLATVMLPVLTHLIIFSSGKPLRLSAEFLGGYAPLLQKLYLRNIVFPELPTLLMSASDLVDLQLRFMPPNNVIPPKAMAMCLAELPRLKTLVIEFIDPVYPEEVLSPPITLTVLPSLTNLELMGYNEYSEDLVARIDTPRLNSIKITYLTGIHVNTQLSHFFYRSVGPFKHAKIHFDIRDFSFKISHPTGCDCHHPITTIISFPGYCWQFSHPHMAQVLSKFSAILSTAVDLKLLGKFWKSHPNDADDLEWLHLLHQFSTVQALYASREIAACLARALNSSIGEIAAKALSSLDLICLEDQSTSSVEKFFAFRELSGHLVTVVGTEAGFDQRLESYVKI